MRIVRFLLTFFISIVVLGAGLFYVLANHSATKTALTCDGRWETGIDGLAGQPEIAFAILEEYRPWIVWAKSDGNIQVQTKNFSLALYLSRVNRIGEGPLAIYSFFDRVDDTLRGGYRSAPKELTIRFTEQSVFVGICQEGI